jgi:hypothetical protein
MKSQWKVITETSLIQQLRAWGEDAQRELFAVQELFREEGPAVFELYANAFTDEPSWDRLREPCPLAFFVQIGKSYLDLELEILPGGTIVFRHARRE